MVSISKTCFKTLSDWTQIVSPHLCIFCESEAPLDQYPAVCESCQKVHWNEPRCQRCQRICHSHDAEKTRCSRCKSISYPFTRFISLGAYQTSLRKAILLTKFHQDPLALKFLQALCKDFPLPFESSENTTWSYIPSQPKRIKERRGRGQHIPQIFKLLSKSHDQKFVELLHKATTRRPQIELNEKERRTELDKSLTYIGPETPPETVYLFDDVWTTGTTLTSACRVLKEHGVKKVFALSIAFNDLQKPRQSESQSESNLFF